MTSQRKGKVTSIPQLWAIALTLIFSVVPVQSQQATNATVNRALQAHGAAALATLRTVTLHGQSVLGTVRKPVTIYGDVTGRVRFDYGLPVERSMVLTSQGMMQVDNGKVSFPPPHVAAFAQLDMLGVVGLSALSGLPTHYTPLSGGAVKGKPTERLNADSGRSQVHYRRTITDAVDVDMDSATGLVAQIARKQYSDRNLDLSFICTWTFSDQRTVNGLVLPFLIEKAIDGRLLETITVETVELNTPFATDLFERVR
jgi:hypothetical protein